MAALMRNCVYRQCNAANLKFKHACLFIKYLKTRQYSSKQLLVTSYRIKLFSKTGASPSLSLLARYQSTGGLFEAGDSTRSVLSTNQGIDTTSISSKNDILRLSQFDEVVNSSTSDVQNTAPPAFDYIPEPPALPPVLETPELASDILGRLEPTLASQDLGGWSPIGLVQHLLDWFHVSIGLPWWGSIVLATVIARTLLLPVFIKSQKLSSNLSNHMPQIQLLQSKISQANMSGNKIEAAMRTNELQTYMLEKKCNPLKAMFIPLAQAPVFISFFIGLRRMASLPIESFRTGGMLWFPDLSLTDPYFLLPVITCTTLFITIELGAEGGISPGQMKTARYVLRAVPLIMFPFIINFPSAILCYWVTTNAITLMFVGLLKFPNIREFLNIPTRIRHEPSKLPVKKKGFVEGIKETFNNSKISREVADRARLDDVRFRRAGMGPVPKTYAYDPTKQRKK